MSKPRTYEIKDAIKRESIEEIGNTLLDLFSGDGDELHLHIRDCKGGNLEPCIELVKQICNSKVPTTITCSGYLVSSGAWLYFKLLLVSKIHPFITVVPPEREVIAVMHKPRVNSPTCKYYGFKKDLAYVDSQSSQLQRMDWLEKETDEVFYKLASELNWIEGIETIYQENDGRLKHRFLHMRDNYENNGDVVFFYDGNKDS